jgi:hypothetical protein
MSPPIIAITMGDASGIGPEIIMKALAREDVYAMCRPLVVGDAGRLREAGAIVGSRLRVAARATPGEATYAPGTVDVHRPRADPGGASLRHALPSPARRPTATSSARRGWSRPARRMPSAPRRSPRRRCTRRGTSIPAIPSCWRT